MRIQILLTAFLGLAVSGCGDCQPVCESCGVTDDDQPQEQFTSGCIPYSVIKTNEDGSLFIQYEFEIMVPRRRTFMDANGQEIVCTEIERRFEERISTVPPGTDVSDYLRVHAGASTPEHEPDLRLDEYVDPAPAPSVSSDV
jgi:hypothetical protein